MSNQKYWADLYKKAKIPAVGDLIFAYHRGIHQVLNVVDMPNDRYRSKLVFYIQVADSNFNPIQRNRRRQSCNHVWTTPFEDGVRARGFVNPEALIERLRRMV